VFRQILAESIAQIYRAGKLLFEPRSLGAVADHDLGAGPVHFQECLDILFDGDSADIGGDGARQREKTFRIRLEYLGVDAAAPSRQVLEAMRCKIMAHRGGAHHASLCRAMEPAQRAIRGTDRHREARAQVLRELRVIRGGKTHAMAQTEASRAEAERPLGRDVQGLRRVGQDAALQPAIRKDRQPNFRVCRAGNVVEVARIDDPHFVTKTTQPRHGLRQRTDHAVGLRKPRVGNDHDPHARLHWHRGMTIR